MTKIQAIKASIEHWQRMIAWAEKQPDWEEKKSFSMNKAIGEHWYGTNCPLCWKYTINNCFNCPLSKKYGFCSSNNKRNLWFFVTNSYNWGEWLINAKKFIKQLKSLLPKEK